MPTIYHFIIVNQQIILIALLSFLLGAISIGGYLYHIGRRRLVQANQAHAKLQNQFYLTREELANLKGQQGQLEAQLQQQTALVKEARLQLGQEFENLAHRIFESKQRQFDQRSQTTLNHSLTPLKQQLEDFKKQVADVYQKESAERNQLVGKISELQQQTQKIGQDAINLAQALKGDNKTQGNWGELILERLLEEAGLQKGREYTTQASFKDETGQRRQPDVIVHLPEKKQLIIDAKVSLSDYERYVSEQDEPQKQQALQAHIQSMRSHIRQLSKKNYESLDGVQSLDFILIFMPIEAAFMLALQHDPSLYKEAYDKQIILVSPTTLLATLKTVSNLWRYHKQHKYAETIASQAGGLYDQFALVIDSLLELGQQLEKTQKSYDTVYKRLNQGRGNLVGRIEKLKKLGARTKRTLPLEKLVDEEQLDLINNQHVDD